MKVALLGYGNVGGGAYDIICEMKGGLAVKHILARSIRPGMEAVMTTDFKDILNDEEIDIVAETIGGLHPAYEYVTEALKAKKHVVSANKQLICHYYSELMALAGENGVQLRFTSSPGGGEIPHRQLAGAGYAGHKVQRNRPERAEESHTCG